MILAAVTAATACTFSDIDLEGRSCPCAPGWRCDSPRNVCIREQIIPKDTGVHDDAGATDAPGAPDGTMDPDATPPDEDGGTDEAGVPDGGPGMTCSVDLDCAADEVCDPLSKTCTVAQTCTRDEDCMPGLPEQVCDTTAMKCRRAQLMLGTDCAINTQCLSQYCLSVNNSLTGAHRFCSSACSASADCPDLMSCQLVSQMGFCIVSRVFENPPTWTTPSGGACMMGSNMCHSGICDTGINVCLETCSRHADCMMLGDNCQANTVDGDLHMLCRSAATGTATTGTSCSNNLACASRICDRVSGKCAEPCKAEADCQSSETCAIYDYNQTEGVAICRPKSPNTGNIPLGMRCVSALICESEVCVPNRPSPPSQKICSSICARDADCDFFPNGGLCFPATVAGSGLFSNAASVPNLIAGVCLPNE